ncbi:TPA: GspM family type II secretion system protein LspM [Legionella pneumophila]|uniref:General secretion pathway protein n=1 Tax=Legionella pneumophila subsp. pneumophila TaxID=91891 RepID=A0AAV2UWT7_LEGPN|nr:GspM family type II secretion system protein LspM [Legionella pneumophila]MCZ4805119.1 GspM family type II secretion system protein LspM [Legionella pneumophila]MDW8854641.1 GspM family type II secretion system protein LspM [Legionella pneumophila]MDW8867336.1 GspM family type II secretion system protein LspM [Legionella pneumophila]MDW8921973.1 GspM family type II secretion system protein LspM [Legionella pneumophila]MDW8928220.1 GspM family type II secretion system protein LspM [Legionell
MKTYLNTLNDREKWMVIVAGVSLFIYGYYLLLYAPLSNQVNQKSTQLIEKTETLEWMKQVRMQKRSAKRKESVDNSQLLTILASQLKNNKTLKFPYQLQQTGSGDVQLTFDTVPFQNFIQWLAKINEVYSINIKQFDVEKTSTPGVTRLMIILSTS